MKVLELKEMENLQGGWSWETGAVGGLMAGVNLSGFGPWGFLGGLVGGCIVANL